VKGDKWVLRLEVVGFKGISGGHNGDNLGRYFMGLCDRVGICSRKESKVRRLVSLSHAMELPDSILTLHTSTSCNQSRWTTRQTNNGTICQTIQKLHEGQHMDWNADQNQLMYILHEGFFIS
jgi:hypothetical protein